MDTAEESARLLRAAVAALYEVFAGYPRRDWTDPCPHCYPAEAERVLRRAPLRELTDNDLQSYAFGALSVWGDLEDFEPVLTGIMLFEDDLVPYLSYWERSTDPAMLANLAEYGQRIRRIRAGERSWNAYLDVGRTAGPYVSVRPGPDQVVSWLTSPNLAIRLAARRATLPSPEAEAALEDALHALGDLRSMHG